MKKRTILIAVVAISIGVLVALLAPAADATVKVTLCHNGNTITVGWPAAYGNGGHLYPITNAPRVGHSNDYLGECKPPPSTSVPSTTTTEKPATTTTTEVPVTTTTEAPVTTTTEAPAVTTTTEPEVETSSTVIENNTLVVVLEQAEAAEAVVAEPSFTG